jgi:hypothetical protein
MITGPARRVLLIVPLIASWGCRSEPGGPVGPPAAGQRTAAVVSEGRPAADSPVPGPAVDRPPGQPGGESAFGG